MTDRAVSSSINLEHDVFVPVAIDAEREIDEIPMLRATYFVVTTDAPSSVWEIELPPLARLHGLGALGMLGVVFSALRQKEETGRQVTKFDLFTDPDDVAAMFEMEREGTLSIQLEDIWFPQQWCAGAPAWGSPEELREAPIKRGEVFRVGAELFQQAYRYGAGDINTPQLLETDPTGMVFRSPQESEALRGWAQNQIDNTRRAFLEKELKLRVRPY